LDPSPVFLPDVKNICSYYQFLKKNPRALLLTDSMEQAIGGVLYSHWHFMV
jgi:hypothetical protein